MPAEAIAAALFAPHQRVMLHHQRPDILEANRCLVDRHAVAFTQLVCHACRRDASNHRSTLTSYLKQIVDKQSKGLQLCDEASLLVHDPKSVRITVSCQSNARRSLLDQVPQRAEIVSDRL